MSGCGCGSPVVLSAPAAARMDVEGSLLCDVLADGTVAAQALVEAVYDTSTGLRVGTRTVNPVTGADYLVQGTLQPCPPPEQCSCETVLLCDQPLGGDEVIQGLDVSGGTLANGVAWQVTGSQNAPDVSDRATEDGAWWRTAIFPNQPVGPTTWTFNRPAAVEFSVFLMWTAYEDTVGGNRAQLPPGAEPISLPPGYSYDPATSIVSVDDTRAGDCAGLTNPTEGVSARFRLAGPVESFTLLYLGERSTASPCAEFGTWFFGAVHVHPVPVPFLRHICRTCTGTATVTDTTLDGVTTYDTSTGTVGVCGPTSGETASGRQIVERCACDDVNGDGSVIVRYVELWSVNTGNPDDEPLLLGTWQDGDFTMPYEPVNPVDCPAGAPEEVAAPIVLGHVCYDDGTGTVRTAAVVRCAGCDDTTVRYVDIETGAEVTAPAVVPCPGATSGPAPVCYTAPSTPPVTCGTVTVTDLTGGAITGAAVADNPQNWPISQSGLASTWDGDTGEAGGPATSVGVVNCNDFQGDTGVVLDYTITPPASNVTGVNLWNAFGGSIGDRDGIGSSTLTLLDADGNTLFTGPLNACRPAPGDYATPCLTDLGSPVDGVATMRLSNIAKVPTSEGTVGPDIGWREIGLVTTGYEALLTLDCGGQQVTATVEGAAAGLTYAGGQLTQTAGPHTLTWHATAGFAGTIVTDTPGAFDRLDFTDGTAVTMSGDSTVSFAVQVSPAATADGPLVGFVTLDPVTGMPTVRDANTGQVVADALIVPCPGDADCASPTTPVTSVGLCLADGTPIAVTITRDCTGATVSEGWLNLATGAFTAGAVPVGTVACGDSRSIQVSGTFCAVDAAGDVVALVLVEYTYDDTGAIADVRLVDAVTGATYMPPAGVTVTTCPTGTVQPEQDAVVLCHTATDGTVTQFVRDYRRDETGTITAHSDYLLDGTPYTPDPTGTVGVCQTADCETQQLCDVEQDVPAVLPSFGVPTEAWQDLTNGVRWMRRGADGAAPGGWYGADNATTPERFDFDRPVSITYSVRFSGPTAAPLRIPAGWYLDGLNTVQHAWDAATRTISPTASATQAGQSTFRIEAQTAQTMTAPVVVGTQPSGQSSQYGQITVTADRITPFLRTLCRDATGTLVRTDTTLDGVTLYDVNGTEGSCPEPPALAAPECLDCETLLLCDVPTAAPVRITGTAASGTLSNGVSWTSTSPTNATYSPQRTNADGSWWGMPSFPLAVTTPTKWTFSRPSFVEFSVYVAYNATQPALNTAQLPAGLEPVSLPTGYAYDPATGVLTRTSDGDPADPCSYTTDPQVIGSARFRTTSAVTTFTTAPAPNSRVARCGIFFTYWAGAVSVVPGGPFLRHICRSCDGTPTVTNTLLDGVTPYLPAGTVDQCQPVDPPQEPACCPTSEAVSLCHTAVDGTVTEFVRDYRRDATGVITGYSDYTLDGADYVPDPAGTVGQCRPVDCTSTPLCVRPSGVVEFISNADNRTDGTVDQVWKWSSGGLAGPWFDMYQVGVYPGWTVADPGTSGGTAHWVAPHPDRGVANTGLPGEGPTIAAANADWYARASFELPSFADPATIKISSTVLNADQVAVEWRLNNGDWQAVNRNHAQAPYTFGPAAVPGAQAGTNTLYVHVRETVFGSGAAGVMMHLVATYDVDATAYEQWLRTTCTDGTVTYLDGDGNPQTGIPATSTIVPCPGGTGGDAGFDVETWPLCILDSTGAVAQHVRAEQVYDTAGVATGAPRLVDAVTGDPATIPAGGSVTVCPSNAASSGRQLVERCGCSDEDDDGTAETRYVELWSVDTTDPDDAPLLLGTWQDGDFDQPITPAAPMDCPGDSSGPGATKTLTGARSVTGTAPQDLVAEFPGLQSVTLIVHSGTALATLSSGTDVPFPAGVSGTWSTGGDGLMDAAAFEGADAGTSYLLLWTYTA
ncbi:hypothetical protein VSR01_16240 [Actinacidiphila sp. DG2A-62]|uniref:hypothetical protein n=1 Tax=Actinacidiphila sp. DG2A-62 TaxID=3108821 RepID=UPI002DBF420C|nr:hypothetical protein [Actinacidiphila sp. DG2A-62]MEC3994995.1 hypothetical protein [Actinacidiphila sp. DG2A-62]